LRVSWQPVNGAFAYEVLKRKIGTTGQRQFKGVPGREYFDGDDSTTGWSHVAYAHDGSNSYEDKGFIREFYAPIGLSSTSDANGFNEMLDTEYAVRAVSINPNNQAGVSDLSGAAALSSGVQDVTSAIQAAISNVHFANGIFEFDQTVKNNGVAAVDKTAYSPINFKITHVSNPTITVANADNGGDGKNTPGIFVYNQSLAAGDTSAPRHLSFNDPQAQMFTFDALVTAFVRGGSVAANGSQPGDGSGTGPQQRVFNTVTDKYTGLLVAGSAGSQLVNGVDYVDVPFVAKANSFSVQGTSDASPVSAGVAPDFDLELLDDQGHVLASSANLGPNEQVGAGITPGKTYVYRVIGYASGPTQFVITSTQFINGPVSGSASSSGSGFLPAVKGVQMIQQLVRFTVNPLTGTVTAQIVK
jgi:hypothetical protein